MANEHLAAEAVASKVLGLAAWTVGVANQFLWATWIIASGTWGMAPMDVVLTVIFIRNFIKWRAEACRMAAT